MMATRQTPIWAIDYDPDVAELYRKNISQNILIENILTVNPASLERPKILLISPPCPSFSNAKTNRRETPTDIALSTKTCDFITVLDPDSILIENVPGYRNSTSYLQLIATLTARRYYWDEQVVNAADYGVPQTRSRLLIRASRTPIPPLIPTHSKNPTNTIWGYQQPWVGWHEAIEDLIPTLPKSKLAKWQVERILDRDVPFTALVERSGARTNPQIRAASSPSFTIKAMSGNMRPNCNQMTIAVCEPIPDLEYLPDINKREVLDTATCYRASTLALARLQTFPDNYHWSDSERINIRGIGNAVPCLLAKIAIESFVK
jgi:DNA (cytosine-5)-methyltransferase 1